MIDPIIGVEPVIFCKAGQLYVRFYNKLEGSKNRAQIWREFERECKEELTGRFSHELASRLAEIVREELEEEFRDK